MKIGAGIVASVLACVLVATVIAPIFALNRDSSLPIPIPPEIKTTKLVALGDSYTAGPGVLPYEEDSIADQCFRSEDAYPLRTARLLGIEGKNVACSGATTTALSDSYKTEKPQLDNIKDADIIVMTMGGNDVRALQTISENPTLAISPTFLADFESQRLVPLQATLDAAYAKIKAAAKPDAKILIVGYPNVFPANRADFQYCDGIQLPLGPSALGLPVENLHILNAKLNDTIKAATLRAGFNFVDVAPFFNERDVCADLRLIWGTVDAPAPEGILHPSGDGHRVIADVVAGAIKSVDPGVNQAQVPIP